MCIVIIIQLFSTCLTNSKPHLKKINTVANDLKIAYLTVINQYFDVDFDIGISYIHT